LGRTPHKRNRPARSGRAALTAVGIARPRNADGSLGERQWKRLFGFAGGLIAAFVLYTMIPPAASEYR